ncbi:MAG: transcription termination factor Rho [Lachnospiraceae bacterium]|nr:transcription termination factor Rho [Lachnospiraceae bacterium]
MDYSHMTAAELRNIAKEKGIKKTSSMKKQELLDALENLEKELAAAVLELESAADSQKEAAESESAGSDKAESGDAENEGTKSEGTSEDEASDGEASNAEGMGTENAEGEQKTYATPFRKDPNALFVKGDIKEGILEILPEGFAFIRSENFLPGESDVYVSPQQIRRLSLRTGDIITAVTKDRMQGDKFNGMLYAKEINGQHINNAVGRPWFEKLTPIFPHERLRLETPGCKPAMRIMDILSPIGKGQRGMIVSQPKAGKTTLLKQIANAIIANNPEMHMIILLIDERPEEVTDIKESIQGENVEVIYSTFDELPENHKRVSEMVIERAKRLVEQKRDVVILLDSITRLARAYNLTCTASGRTLSGGLDPAALHMPKKFFGAARCMREGGSLTILATALVETGSRMDDVVFEEFKGTGNMELVLDRNLSEKRIFPAIDLPKSSTRRDDLLLTQEESEVNEIIRHAFNSARSETAVEKIINLFARTKNNKEFCEIVKKTKLI